MKWQGRQESTNVEDRRGSGPSGPAIGAGIGGLLIVVVGLLLGFDPQQVARVAQMAAPAGNPNGPGQKGPVDPEEEKRATFSKVVFHDTEVVWNDLFRQAGKKYEQPVLVLFTGQVESACGSADSAVGPFYCPADRRVYIDLGFYRDMQKQLNSPGEFARAYVIAHEVGHHVQSLLGYSKAAHAKGRANPSEANRMSVRLELQADFLAGVWAHHAQKKFNFLEKGDIESALNAAFEIGDDRLQKKARGQVVPDSFTHGTSKQRQRWFLLGYQKGNVEDARQLFEIPYDDL